MNTKKLLLFFTFWIALVYGCSIQSPLVISQKDIIPSSPTPVDEIKFNGLTDEEVVTLKSLRQVDDYPLYTMRYSVGYNSNVSIQEDQFTAWGSRGKNWGCSLFTTFADPDMSLFGRNFDWDFSPGLLLYTDPSDGYASVSMIDIGFLGFQGEDAKNLIHRPLTEISSLLAAPYLPFDGINEMGLAVGMAAVPPGNMVPDPQKQTLGSLGVIRELLDQASDVAEAIEIMEDYNIDFEGGPPLHYLVSDRTGAAVLIEFYQGDQKVIYNKNKWLQATNFLHSAVDEPEGQCPRYDKISQRIKERNGFLTTQDAMNLLQQISQSSTQWSVVYNISNGDIWVGMGHNYNKVHVFDFEMEIIK